MEKLNMQTTDVVDENIKRIGELFPNCLTEVKDEKGRPVHLSNLYFVADRIVFPYDGGE